jgi:hypothetical protein
MLEDYFDRERVSNEVINLMKAQYLQLEVPNPNAPGQM